MLLLLFLAEKIIKVTKRTKNVNKVFYYKCGYSYIIYKTKLEQGGMEIKKTWKEFGGVKDKIVRLRIDGDEILMLSEICEYFNINKSQFLRARIHEMHDKINTKNDGVFEKLPDDMLMTRFLKII